MAGWSLETIRPKLDVIFNAEGLRYKVQHPNALSPRVFLHHEGELSNEAREIVTRIFPDGVYIDFIPEISLPETKDLATLVSKPGTRRVGANLDSPKDNSGTKQDTVRIIKKEHRRIGG